MYWMANVETAYPRHQVVVVTAGGRVAGWQGGRVVGDSAVSCRQRLGGVSLSVPISIVD